MRAWVAGLCVLGVLAALPASGHAQDNDAAKANGLYAQGRKVDALPMYEALAKQFPKEMLYQERLADCLNAESMQLTDTGQIKAVLTETRDAAKRAVELGDTARFIRELANIDPDQIPYSSLVSPGAALLKEAEKAYAAGDFKTAMEKYTAAADADPRLYEAALFAGDTAFVQKDLPTAAKWFARAIAIDPDRETAYRYWGDAILKLGNNPIDARDKFIDAIVAEPYKNLSWQGVENWTAREKAILMPPKIQLPAAPIQDPKNPKNITININPADAMDKKNAGGFAWMMYSMKRATFRGDDFKKDFPDEKEYRHSLREEDEALGMVVTVLKERKLKPSQLDESLRNLVALSDAGMLDCWIVLNAADQGIAQDYPAYRKEHRQLLHDYMARFVVHGGVTPASQ
jgi:tetratricopeptide (TPR) repeat protein